MMMMIIFSNETSNRGSFVTVKEVMGYEFKPFEANFQLPITMKPSLEICFY